MQECQFETATANLPTSRTLPTEMPEPLIDDVLTFVLLTIVISGGDSKPDCLSWWSKAIRLAQSMGLNREDVRCDGIGAACNNIICGCKTAGGRSDMSQEILEGQEERRRVFWLLFCLDRHLALSFNSVLKILDDECEVYSPLPDNLWDSFESLSLSTITHRNYGPPTIVTGVGFFEYFLPLMTILGDVIQIHHQQCHPRFGRLDHQETTTLLESLLADCAQSINEMASLHHVDSMNGSIPASQVLTPSSTSQEQTHTHRQSVPSTSSYPPPTYTKAHAQAQLVTAYSTFILHVVHVLLYGKWDAIAMLENRDGWITSVQFMKCASHAIAASEAVSKILACDPELTFMPYLFGIYLLHGSFILLLFADRMPQIGLNESVEKACEVIIRAHEVCVVTLNTEFQVSFSICLAY